jgi:hypothetical protein
VSRVGSFFVKKGFFYKSLKVKRKFTALKKKKISDIFLAELEIHCLTSRVTRFGRIFAFWVIANFSF